MYAHLSFVSDTFATPWTVAHQAPLSIAFPRQEYWSGLPLPPPGDLSDPRIETPPASPALAGRFTTSWAAGEAPFPQSSKLRSTTIFPFSGTQSTRGYVLLPSAAVIALAGSSTGGPLSQRGFTDLLSSRTLLPVLQYWVNFNMVKKKAFKSWTRDKTVEVKENWLSTFSEW